VQGLDRGLFKAINGGSPRWGSAMEFFSTGLNQTWVKALLLVLLIALIAAGKDTRKGAICALIAFPIANGITDLFKNFAPMPRPCNDPGLLECFLRVGATDSAGTASAHAANMMAVAICFLIAMRWWGIPWLILAFLVGYSRIYNGVHYPYQVGLGWISGAFSAVLVSVIWQKVSSKMAQKKESFEVKPSV
jgi:undecaprenyl-diphosphatase